MTDAQTRSERSSWLLFSLVAIVLATITLVLLVGAKEVHDNHCWHSTYAANQSASVEDRKVEDDTIGAQISAADEPLSAQRRAGYKAALVHEKTQRGIDAKYRAAHPVTTDC